MADNAVTRFLGGSPGMVLVRLILLSILVGVILAAFGLDPANVLRKLEGVVRGVWNMGWGAVRWLGKALLLGAMIVIPIWLIARLFRTPRGN